MDELRAKLVGKILIAGNGKSVAEPPATIGEAAADGGALPPIGVVVAQDNAAARFKTAHRRPELPADPLVGHQPAGRPRLLADRHRSSYSPPMSSATDRRRTIFEEIARAATLAKRDPEEVTAIAVSKTRAVEEIEALIAAGQRDFGESRVQEALEKWPALLNRYCDVRLHCIGRLQSNKAADAVRLFDTIHSLDRETLLEALVREGERSGNFPQVYVQVNIGDEEQKGGCAIGEAGRLIDAVRASPLPLIGLMAIPPLGVEPAPYFALLAKLARRHDVGGLSMGMSADYPAAVKLGATAVRVGTAFFEDRDS